MFRAERDKGVAAAPSRQEHHPKEDAASYSRRDAKTEESYSDRRSVVDGRRGAVVRHRPDDVLSHAAPYSAGISLALFFACMSSNADHTPSFPCHCPRVAAFEYSVLLASKKFACSTPLSIDCSQGSGFSFTP
jgi:hypothetical protein